MRISLPPVLLTLATALAFASPATAAGLTVGARVLIHDAPAPKNDVELSFGVARDGSALVVSNLLRRAAIEKFDATLHPVAGWPRPLGLHGRSTRFSFLRNFVAVSRSGDIAVFDPNGDAIRDYRSSGRPRWTIDFDRGRTKVALGNAGDLAFDTDGSLVLDGGGKLVHVSAAGKLLGVATIRTPFDHLDVRGGKVFLLDRRDGRGADRVSTVGVGGKGLRTVGTYGVVNEQVNDLDVGSDGRPRLLIDGTIHSVETDRVDTIDPASGAVVATAALPLFPGSEFRPLHAFLDLDAADHPVVSESRGITAYR